MVSIIVPSYKIAPINSPGLPGINRESPQARGLVGWWPDANNGLNLPEITRKRRGSGRDGPAKGIATSAVSTRGVRRGVVAAEFPQDTTDEIRLGEWNHVEGLAACSWTFSVIFDAFDDGGFPGIISRNGVTGDRDPWIFTNGNSLNFQITAGSTLRIAGSSTLSPNNKARDFACVWKSGSRQEIWMDGTIIGTAATPAAGTIQTASGSSEEAKIGNLPGGSDRSFPGAIWNVRLYNYDLSQSVVRHIHKFPTDLEQRLELSMPTFFDPSGRIMGSIAGPGGLAGEGGIAGIGGGIAG